MICNICGSSETYVQDGISYCRECSEQIKGSIDEDAGEEGCSRRALLSSPVSKRTKKDGRTALAPWLYSEAYNLILFKQVSALIKLGCSEKLKTVVLSLWARYLQKCESAFIKCSKKEGFIPRLSVFRTRRDAELLYGEGLLSNLKLAKIPHIRKQKYRRKRTPKEGSGKIPNTAVKAPSDSETSVSDISSGEGSESSSTNVKKKKGPRILYSSPARKLKKEGYKRACLVAQKNCISHMTLLKTLSFCHLGLLYTEDQMLLFDLLRLVKEDAVPFFDIFRHFPSTMQLQGFDTVQLRVRHTPDIKEVSSTSAKLIKFLHLPKFKLPPLLPIAIRFVKDLNLPCDLIPVLKLLINKINKSIGERLFTYIPPYEAQALSVVALTLKMLFVLDGKFEVEHSEIMMKLNSISDNRPYFVWKDWQQQMSLKEFLFIKSYTTQDNAAMNLLDTLSADRINGSYHPVTSMKEELKELTSLSQMRFFSSRNEVKTLFKGLITDSSINSNPTSFPLKSELQCLMKGWRRLPLFKDTESLDFNFIDKDFSHHRLYYRPSATTDEPMNLLLSSLYESGKLLYITDEADYFENIIRTSKKYWYVKYTTAKHFKRNRISALPSSFKWLLNFMCKYLQIDMSVFYKEFSYIERIIIEL